MATEEELEYVSRYVVAIFRSPAWVFPISQFVDENCGIFEDQEENKLEYTLIHNAFKRLVEELLEAHLSELEVSPEQFQMFCQHGLTGTNEVHKDLVEQLLSVDDFLVFKAMMVKRNAQLYREALERASLLMGVMAMESLAQEEAQAEERMVAEQSHLEEAEMEAEKLELQRKCAEAELQLAMALSMQLKRRLQLMEALSEVLEALAEMKEGSQLALEDGSPEVSVQPLAVCDSEVQGLDDEHEAARQRERAQAVLERSRQEAALAAAQSAPSEDDRRARAEHLKRQRDLLVAKKNREREEQLVAHNQATGPTNAGMAAEAVLARGSSSAGQQLAAELSGQTPPTSPVMQQVEQDSKAAEMRKMLTRQLKQTLTTSFTGSQ